MHPPAREESSSGTTALCEILALAGKLDPSHIERALRLQKEQQPRERIGSILVKLGFVSEHDVAAGLARQLDLPFVHKQDIPREYVPDERVSKNFLQENCILILGEDQDQLRVVMADPLNRYALDALTLITGKQVQPAVGAASEIETALQQHEHAQHKAAGNADAGSAAERFHDDAEHLKELASEAPVIKLVNQLIQRAVEAGASDIHVEPFENFLKVRFRIDGMLREADNQPTGSAAAIVSRIKIMANLNIAECRLPQDGRFKVRVLGNELDLRVSTVPTMHGESVVLRLLHRNKVCLDFAQLGFGPKLEAELLAVLDQPHGILLVTGPTGSGKTTTLYTALKHLNKPENKILTVEDPVEYNIEGVNQIQTKPQIGLTFANALRSIVRQDPDIIMIGEMRDRETARIAVESALTGHLVLSTLHTNDAAGSITRMLDMGVEDYLLTSTLSAVQAQRLVRTLCPECRKPYQPMMEIVQRWQLDRYNDGKPVTLFQGTGCPACEGSGYSGRVAIMELLIMSDPLRQLVLQHADANSIARAAVAQGMETMLADGLRKALAGITSLEEVLRATQDSHEPVPLAQADACGNSAGHDVIGQPTDGRLP